MDEGRWVTMSDPSAMLRWLLGEPLGVPGDPSPCPVPSDRKLRLFACAACRLVRGVSLTEALVFALGTAELWADGGPRPDPQRVGRAWEDAFAREAEPAFDAMWLIASAASATEAGKAAENAVETVIRESGLVDLTTGASLLRDLVGNPFHSPSPPKARTLDVLAVAHAAYDYRCADGVLDPARLAVLADALEEAGCDELMLLEHLRNVAPCPGLIYAKGTAPHPHVRGCWALDLVLGKE